MATNSNIISQHTSCFYHITDLGYEKHAVWHLEPYAHLTIIYEQQTPISDMVELKFVLNHNSSLLFMPIITNNVQLKIMIQLADFSEAIVNGAYALNDNQTIGIDTVQHHMGQHTTSQVMINGIITDKSHVKYSGIIKIEKNGHKSIASQENKTIILDQQAQVISVPALEVETNDVQCAHGSAIGSLNKEHIHYMQSRGLSETQTKKLLFSSFFYQCLHRIKDNNQKDRILEQLTNKMLAQGMHE